MRHVIVVIGAGSIGQAIGRRVSAGKRVLVADLRQQSADAAAKVLSDAGFDVSTATVDVSSRNSVHALVQTATALGDVTGMIHAAGVSPSQASPETILKVDLYRSNDGLTVLALNRVRRPNHISVCRDLLCAARRLQRVMPSSPFERDA